MILSLLLCLCQTPVENAAAPKAGSPVRVVPGPGIGGGSFTRWVWGHTWRDLWSITISAPVVDLDTARGGMTAFESGGGKQTVSLRFKTPEGRIYDFRSVDKVRMQKSAGLFRRTPLGAWLYRNRASGILPVGTLVTAEFERIAGLPGTEPWLAVLPASPRLGEWQEFAGMLGVFERRYSPEESRYPEIPGAIEVITTRELFRRLEADSSTRVDQNLFLTARLVDLLLGDWDRPDRQWVWAGFDRDGLRWWVPLPRDRDWAFSHLDGVGNWLMTRFAPTGGPFAPAYGNLGHLVVRAEPLDRRLLAGLDRAAFERAAQKLRNRLTDQVLARAVTRLPPEFGLATRTRLVETLKQRRDSLPAVAERFHARLAQVVDLYGTSGADVVDLTRDGEGAVLVGMIRSGRDTVLWRRFLPAETGELRVYPLAGPDTVRVSGPPGPIAVRIIRGEEDFVLAGKPAPSLGVYADDFVSPVESTDPSRRFRDFGSSWGIVPWLNARSELGIILGAGPVHTGYGFRRVPYHYRVALRVGTTSSEGGFNADLRADYRFPRPHSGVTGRAALLNRDRIHYYGLGNETPRPLDRSTGHVVQQEYSLQPVLELGIGRSGSARLQVGGVVQWSQPLPDRITLLAVQEPYGSGSFTEAGFLAGLVYDTRDDRRLPTAGFRLSLQGRAFPAVLDVRNAFASVAVEARSYVAAAKLPTIPTLALRAGGMRVFGPYPYFEAAGLGGRSSFRGTSPRRFIGDGSLYGSAELRLNLGDLGFPFGGDWGVYGLTDLGRVWLEGEASTRWHSAVGGGLWAAVMENRYVLTATAAKSGDDTLRLYLFTGFHF